MSIGGPSGRPRIAFLWPPLSGYMRASLRALADGGADLVVVHRAANEVAPFDTAALVDGFRSYTWTDEPDVDGILATLADFEPDAIVVCSWHIGGYRRVARRLRGRTLRIVVMDNQWLATLKQWAGVVASPLVLRPAFDAVFLPADTQAVFARKLGFPSERTLFGLYTCDYPVFAAVAARREGALPPPAFLYVGRMTEAKAIDVLAAAYERYRSEVSGAQEPWPLLVAGVGPQAGLLDGLKGVEMLGFVQPPDLPAVFERAGCLVLPSRFEPWGTVIHEAAAAGLPVVCTRACGASTRLVLDGYNGLVVSPDNVAGLASALRRIHDLDDVERRAMGAASSSLAPQYTPRRWAETLLTGIPRLREQLGLDHEARGRQRERQQVPLAR